MESPTTKYGTAYLTVETATPASQNGASYYCVSLKQRTWLNDAEIWQLKLNFFSIVYDRLPLNNKTNIAQNVLQNMNVFLLVQQEL
jgi:hypothetical protein